MPESATIISTTRDGNRTYLPIPEAAAEKDALAERLECISYTDTTAILLAALLRQTAIMQRRIEYLERANTTRLLSY